VGACPRTLYNLNRGLQLGPLSNSVSWFIFAESAVKNCTRFSESSNSKKSLRNVGFMTSHGPHQALGMSTTARGLAGTSKLEWQLNCERNTRTK
jgi:hypothetical protein